MFCYVQIFPWDVVQQVGEHPAPVQGGIEPAAFASWLRVVR